MQMNADEAGEERACFQGFILTLLHIRGSIPIRDELSTDRLRGRMKGGVVVPAHFLYPCSSVSILVPFSYIPAWPKILTMPDDYLDAYRDAQDDFGNDFGVTLWANTRSQEQRFKVFNQMCYLPGKRLLDAGCSRGDLADYLVRQGVEYASYVGVDGLPEVIDYARKRELPRAAFHAGDFVADVGLLSIGKPQVITFSGTLNTMDDDTAMTLLHAAWEACSETLLFNFLSTRSTTDRREELGPARRLDPLKYMDWAMQRTPAVRLRQDYFKSGHDATIMMRKVT